MNRTSLTLVPWVLFAVLVILNAIDFATTAYGLTSGGFAESNETVNYFGGPISPISILIKLVLLNAPFLLILYGVTTIRDSFVQRVCLAIVTFALVCLVLRYTVIIGANVLLLTTGRP
jgi:hypothetical protein